MLSNLLKSEQEKDILIGLSVIKEFVRVPKITKDNQRIKEEMLGLEEKTLADFVDFSRVMIQKFDRVSVDGDNLVLEKDKEKVKLPIKENKDIIKKALAER